MQVTVPHDSAITLERLEAQINDVEARIGRIVDLQAVELEEDGATRKSTMSAHLLWTLPTAMIALKKEGEEAPDGATLEIAGTAYYAGSEDKQVLKVYRLGQAAVEPVEAETPQQPHDQPDPAESEP